MKARYFTVFSYIGTRFRSSEKLWLKDGSTLPDPESVQGMIELGLLKQKSKNFPMVKLSSRTDGGVHALNCSAHFDLEGIGTFAYDPNKIAYHLNSFFRKTNTQILIKKCMRVPDNFNARYLAISRTYLYRLAVLKKGIELPENTSIGQVIPIEELNRCHFTRVQNFDIERLKEGAKYFVGYHDFGSFRRFNKQQQHKHNRRAVYSLDVRPGRRLAVGHPDRAQDGLFDYWDIEIRGKSFVHNQIRRMVGTLISVAVGLLPPEEIKVMLQIPSKHSWYHFIQCCPPSGLYLCNVEYDPKDLIYDAEVDAPPVTSDDVDSDSD